MKSEITHIPLERATPGLILGEDLLDPSGHILLPAGVVLTDAMLSSLRRRGIAELAIAVEPTTAPEELARREAQVRQRLAHLFRKAGDDILMQTLARVVLEYRLEAL